jgi:hypothetical protein
MTVVSSKDFVANQEKYFDMALDEQIMIKRGNNMFHLLYNNLDDTNTYHAASVYDEVLEPDDEFRRAISADEFRKRLIGVLDRVDKKYANKCK